MTGNKVDIPWIINTCEALLLGTHTGSGRAEAGGAKAFSKLFVTSASEVGWSSSFNATTHGDTARVGDGRASRMEVTGTLDSTSILLSVQP